MAIGLLQVERHNAHAAIAQLDPALRYFASFIPMNSGVLAKHTADRLALLHGAEDVDWQWVDILPKVAFITLQGLDTKERRLPIAFYSRESSLISGRQAQCA